MGTITAERRYRATLLPATVPPSEAELKADQGVLPVVQFKAANSGRAEYIAHQITGLPVLRVERIEAPQPDEVPLPALQAFSLTYSPAHRASGSPLNPHASRQVLAERKTITVHALTADAAVRRFERQRDLMVTACTRLQPGEAGEWE